MLEDNLVRKLSELRKIKCFRVTKKVVGGYCIGDENIQKEDILKELSDRGLDTSKLEETTDGFQYEDRFVFKPKIKRTDSGVLIFRSKDYVFISDETKSRSYGCELNSSNLTDYGITIDTFNKSQKIEYIIEEELGPDYLSE